jgi:hypothetical protein
MTALAAGKNRIPERFRDLELPLAVGEVAYKGGAAFIASGKFETADVRAGGFFAGNFNRSVDATAVSKKASIDVGREVIAWWYSNATAADAGDATTVGKLVYWMDDNTVSPVTTGRTLAGRCWGFDAATNRLLVERLST